MTPLTAPQALDQFFLDARSRLLDVAATLDRIGRGADASTIASDPRMARLRLAVEALLIPTADRAERIQTIFSLPYDPNWPVPAPRGGVAP